MSVTGEVPVSTLGITLTHEHLVNDVQSWAHRTKSLGVNSQEFWERPVSMDVLWELRNDPFGNLDNCRLDDRELAVRELERFRALGGATIVDTTSMNGGRDLPALRQLSERSGVTIIAGTGYYLEPSLPRAFATLSAEDIAELILADLRTGVAGVRPGIIGEIGVGAEFPEPERRSLHGALLAQRETGLPIQVHLPAWFRRGHEVLDIAEQLGVSPASVVLCHMGPSGADVAYQHELLARGAWLQYDMIGMEVFYADQGVQCPSDAENAGRIVDLAEAGHLGQILISQDVFLKSLLREYGGPGYGHILQYFVPRLRNLGFDDAALDQLLVHNPRDMLTPRGV
ncbi:phosphotriesterase family protein [Leucobacter luti]|uniref:Phosphotriesterase-related protein n=1 Tax=Leucobacter luti TaxID=340320 RepID=A0A4Q7U4X2_9MICO|nr:phosphotriesterase-related protein [Leucobacter luti]MBL3700472.1 phosphotriesterase-related protein [Leucobacter luti]RZT68694.1 phosphotriesterase-related protein [Leucobacter luti]